MNLLWIMLILKSIQKTKRIPQQQLNLVRLLILPPQLLAVQTSAQPTASTSDNQPPPPVASGDLRLSHVTRMSESDKNVVSSLQGHDPDLFSCTPHHASHRAHDAFQGRPPLNLKSRHTHPLHTLLLPHPTCQTFSKHYRIPPTD